MQPVEATFEDSLAAADMDCSLLKGIEVASAGRGRAVALETGLGEARLGMVGQGMPAALEVNQGTAAASEAILGMVTALEVNQGTAATSEAILGMVAASITLAYHSNQANTTNPRKLAEHFQFDHKIYQPRLQS